ncbi:MAG: hypothetical protein HOM14_00310 [Gammaproteobacteria bacterium]|jgi:hypothetical protein|nr:hypothetical protein [Gammaproteobacteria bacterium]MBT4195636.1 hypothetical protein [Gammaproteobacteria bacterium]MBT4860942.1 hypothetical protein [Gammaproteobacteria bacterium]MBT6454510.1 hypothetical protein [Gammaproteobacteria bacterium]MBT6549775.1 hypothetical protein [Gammaproteobacteria bacterium]
MTYSIHPSLQLVSLFKNKPYQGQEPSKSKIIILGNDANYSPEISTDSFFEYILEYHQDGVAFLKKYGVHHPFLLDSYPFHRGKGGVPYHRKFAKLGLSQKEAMEVSFVELLHLPTIGNTGADKRLFYEMLDKDHLQWIEDIIFSGKNKFVVVNQTLAGMVMKISQRMDRLNTLSQHIYKQPVPSVVLQLENITIFNGFSFSASHASNTYLHSLSIRMHDFLSRQ